MSSFCFGFLTQDTEVARKAIEEKVAAAVRSSPKVKSQASSLKDDLEPFSAMTGGCRRTLRSITRRGTARCRHADTFLSWWYDIELVDGMLLLSRSGRLEDSITLESATVISKDVEVMVSYGERLAWTMKFRTADEAHAWGCALQSAIAAWSRHIIHMPSEIVADTIRKTRNGRDESVDLVHKVASALSQPEKLGTKAAEALDVQQCSSDLQAAKKLQEQKESMAFELFEFKNRVLAAEQEKKRLRQHILCSQEELARVTQDSRCELEEGARKWLQDLPQVRHVDLALRENDPERVALRQEVSELSRAKSEAQVEAIALKTKCADLENMDPQLPAEDTKGARTNTIQSAELKQEKEQVRTDVIISKTSFGDLQKVFARQQTPRFGRKQAGSAQAAVMKNPSIRTLVADTKSARKSTPVWTPRAKALQKTKSAPLPFPATGSYVM